MMDDDAIVLTPVGPQDHARGPADAPVTLVEYGDYQCPYCRAAAPIVDAVEARFTGRLRFVFRQLPLRAIHQHAEAAAEAAEAAGAQGRFWPMHAALLGDDAPLDRDGLVARARTAGVPDLARFERELHERTYRPVLDAAIAAAESSGVSGTPTFFIDGQPFEGEPDVDAMTDAIDEVLAAQA